MAVAAAVGSSPPSPAAAGGDEGGAAPAGLPYEEGDGSALQEQEGLAEVAAVEGGEDDEGFGGGRGCGSFGLLFFLEERSRSRSGSGSRVLVRDALLLESFKARGSAFPLSSCFFCISQQAICASKKANRSRSCASGEESDARTAAEILFCSMVVFFFSVSKGAGRSDVSINQSLTASAWLTEPALVKIRFFDWGRAPDTRHVTETHSETEGRPAEEGWSIQQVIRVRRNVGGRRRCEVLSEGENSRARCFLSIAHASGTSESASERAARWRERGRQARAGKEGESEKKRGGSNVKKGKRKVEQKGGKNSLLPASLACLLFSFSASVLARSHLFCFIRTHSFFVVFDLSLPLSLSLPPPFHPGPR